MTIDVEALRNDLINYFGTASFYNPVAMMDMIDVETASDEELIELAIRIGFDLNRYEVEDSFRNR